MSRCLTQGRRGRAKMLLPSIGTPEAVGGAASTKISSRSKSPPNMVKPVKTENNKYIQYVHTGLSLKGGESERERERATKSDRETETERERERVND